MEHLPISTCLWIALSSVVWLNGSPLGVYGMGSGPIGLWVAPPESEEGSRTAIVADSSIPGLALVDLKRGQTLERLRLKGINPSGIMTCWNCTYALVTGNRERSALLRFPDTVNNLVSQQPSSMFTHVKVKSLKIVQDGGTGNHSIGKDMDAPTEIKKTMGDNRIGVMTSDGRYAYVALYYDQSVYRIDFGADSEQRPVLPLKGRVIMKQNKTQEKPYSVALAAGDSHLLVTMNKKRVWRIDRHADYQVIAKYNLMDRKNRRSLCPGMELSPNLRHAVEDPKASSSSLLISATSKRTYDAVLWRYHVNSGKCRVVVGGIGRGPGWIDGHGEVVYFTRPHHYVLSQGRQIIMTDIDNRALRQIDGKSGLTRSIMYDRDRRRQEIQQYSPSSQQASVKSCLDKSLLKSHGGMVVDDAQLVVATQPPLYGSNHSKKAPFLSQTTATRVMSFRPSAQGSEAEEAASMALSLSYSSPALRATRDDEDSYQWTGTSSFADTDWTKQLWTFSQAQQFCEVRGARLCDSWEIRAAGILTTTAWTRGECGSCWKLVKSEGQASPQYNNHCDFPLRTEWKGSKHSAPHFRHSWNHGHAMEYIDSAKAQAASYCPGVSHPWNSNSKPLREEEPVAKAPICCADCIATSVVAPTPVEDSVDEPTAAQA